MGIQSFGMMMAIAFLIAGKFLHWELLRKEKEGLLLPTSKKSFINEPVKLIDIVFQSFWGFLLGFKLLYIVFNYSSCAANPQQVLFSLEGSIPGGLILAAIFGYLRWKEGEKNKKEGLKEIETLVYPSSMSGNLVLISAISGLIGAKVFSYLESPTDFDYFWEDPAAALFSGLTIYGGLLFGFIGIAWYARKNKMNVLVLFDAASPALILGYAIGRIGCQISGDGDWGIDNLAPKPEWLSAFPDWVWAYNYPHNVNGEGIPIPGCAGPHCFMLENPVFPTPLYEIIMCFGIFVLLWAIRKRFSTAGLFFSVYLVLNGIERFAIEQIRVNSTYDIFGHAITQAEIISTLLFFTGLAGIIFLKRKNKNELHTSKEVPESI